VEEDRTQTSRQRVTVAQASEILGVTVEAVRGRIKRGTLEHERHSGTVYVLLDADQTPNGHQPADDQTIDQRRPDDPEDLAGELRDRIRYLERQVEEEREARRRADTLLAQLVQRFRNWNPREGRENLPRPPRSNRTGVYKAPVGCPGRSGGRTAPVVAESVRRIGGACRTIRLHRTRRGY
jgi:hypothetical protein